MKSIFVVVLLINHCYLLLLAALAPLVVHVSWSDSKRCLLRSHYDKLVYIHITFIAHIDIKHQMLCVSICKYKADRYCMVVDLGLRSLTVDTLQWHQHFPRSHRTQCPTHCLCRSPLCLHLQCYLLPVAADQLCKELCKEKVTGLQVKIKQFMYNFGWQIQDAELTLIE